MPYSYFTCGSKKAFWLTGLLLSFAFQQACKNANPSQFPEQETITGTVQLVNQNKNGYNATFLTKDKKEIEIVVDKRRLASQNYMPVFPGNDLVADATKTGTNTYLADKIIGIVQ